MLRMFSILVCSTFPQGDSTSYSSHAPVTLYMLSGSHVEEREVHTLLNMFLFVFSLLILIGSVVPLSLPLPESSTSLPVLNH